MKFINIFFILTNFLYCQSEFTNIEEALKTPDKVTRLNLQWIKSIDKIPKEVYSFKNLKDLQFAVNPNLRNNLDGLGRLTNLEKLTISTTNTTMIPDSIKYLKNLKFLSIIQNGITKIPECICELQNLESLYLYSNLIEEIPDCIKKMKKLENLLLHGNRMSDESIMAFRSYMPNLNYDNLISSTEMKDLTLEEKFSIDEKFHLIIKGIEGEKGLANFSKNGSIVTGRIIQRLENVELELGEYYVFKMDDILEFNYKEQNFKSNLLIIRNLYKQQPLRKRANKVSVAIAIIKDKSILNSNNFDVEKIIFAGIGSATQINK